MRQLVEQGLQQVLKERNRPSGFKLRDASFKGKGLSEAARIAALCLHHGVRELWTADRDFNRFPKLTVRNPLVG